MFQEFYGFACLRMYFRSRETERPLGKYFPMTLNLLESLSYFRRVSSFIFQFSVSNEILKLRRPIFISSLCSTIFIKLLEFHGRQKAFHFKNFMTFLDSKCTFDYSIRKKAENYLLKSLLSWSVRDEDIER